MIPRFAFVVLRAWVLLMAFDAARLIRRGTPRIQLPALPRTRLTLCELRIAEAVRAVDVASSLYWKRTTCLQRAVSLCRLVRKLGANAQLVVGYRPQPFTAHAWVEIDGRPIAGAAGYAARLRTLLRA